MSQLKKSQVLVYDDLEPRIKKEIQAFLDEKVPNPADKLKGEKLIKSIVKHNRNDELGRQVVAYLRTHHITVGRALNGGDGIQFYGGLEDDVHDAVVGKLWDHFAETGKGPDPYEPSTRAKSPPTKGRTVTVADVRGWSSDDDEGSPPAANPGQPFRTVGDIRNEAEDDSSAIRLYATWLNKTFSIPAAGVSWKAASVFNVRYGNLDSDVVRPLWLFFAFHSHVE